MFSESTPDTFPSFLDQPPSKLNALALLHDSSSDSPNKNYYEDMLSPNHENIKIQQLPDLMTDKQYEDFSKAMKKAAASLPSKISYLN